MKFELYTRYTLTIPNGLISDVGIQEITSFIWSQDLTSDLWVKANPNGLSYISNLPKDWDYSWLVQSGEYVGTFPKRVSKFYWTNYSVKCPASFLAEIGQIAKRHSIGATYTFEFTDKFTWARGEFGDPRSCFWTNRSDARILLKDNGGLAIRFFDGESGLGRAWLAPIENDMHIIFNGYAQTACILDGNPTLNISRVFAHFVGLSYKKISLSNHGKTDGTLWINDDSGYAIGTADQLKEIDRYDFEWGDENICWGCSDPVNEGNDYIGIDGHTYCQDCYYERFDTCDSCGESHWNEEITWVQDTYERYCDGCFGRYCTDCARCYEPITFDNACNVKGEYYCQRCAERL